MEIVGRLTADLDHVARSSDEAMLRTVKQEFSELQGAKGVLVAAFGRPSVVVDVERKLRFLLSHGVQLAEEAVARKDEPDDVQALGEQIRELTNLMVDDPIRGVLEQEVWAAIAAPEQMITKPVSGAAERKRIDDHVSAFGGMRTAPR